MSEDFENKNGSQPENNENGFSQEPQNSPNSGEPFEESGQFVSGEYHFARPKGDEQNSGEVQNGFPQQSAPPQPEQRPYVPYEWNSNGGGYRQPNQGFQQNGYRPPVQTPPKKSATGKIVALVILLVAAVLAVCGLIVGGLTISSRDHRTEASSGAAAEQTTNAPAENILPSAPDSAQTSPSLPAADLSAVDVAEKVRKSVVGVMTYKNGQISGEGSGVVMGLDSTGQFTYIITCAHVISENGVTYGILTLDGKTYEAYLVATDVRTDIGVLKVNTTELSPADFADSKNLRVGETVYAIGNPGGSAYFGSMTDGIVSAIDRSVSATYNITCIQHNAAINPGNSGGALVNAQGKVIGINSSKIAATDFEGMGFAIPMSTVNSIVSDLIQYGYVPNRPRLGIQYASVDKYQLYSMVVAVRGLPAGSLVIAGISKDSSLANTDAKVGDMIIGVDGKPMNNSDVLLDLIDKGAVGDTITLNLCRVDNRTYKITKFDVTITLIEDKGDLAEEETTISAGEYNYGGASSFEDFFNEYFGGFGGFGR